MLLILAAACRPLRRRRLEATLRNLDVGSTARVAASNWALRPGLDLDGIGTLRVEGQV